MSSMAMDFVHKMNNLAGPIGPWIVLIRREMEMAGQQNSKVFEYLDNIYGGGSPYA